MAGQIRIRKPVQFNDQSLESALAGAALGIIPGGKLVKLLGKTGLFQGIGRLGSSAFKTASHYASKAGARLRGAGGWVARKAQKFVGKGGCGCFTAATLVWTANGAVPIGEIEEGQQVLAAPDEGQAQDYASNEVSTKIVIGEASLVQLLVLHEDGSTKTINTTDEHPFHVADTAQWTRADQLSIGDELSTISGTVTLTGVIFTTERVPVYNLSIPGTPTYYVGERGVWVHNCGAGLHHLIPMYLGGAKKGAKTYLDSTQHSQLHVFINIAGAKRGIPKHSGPGNGTRAVNEWAESVGPETAELKIRESLIEAVWFQTTRARKPRSPRGFTISSAPGGVATPGWMMLTRRLACTT